MEYSEAQINEKVNQNIWLCIIRLSPIRIYGYEYKHIRAYSILAHIPHYYSFKIFSRF